VNVYVIKHISGVPLGVIFKGILPFFAIILIAVGIVIAFPEIALWLPSMADAIG
jgi:TRAP-type C4-dicarboxylate transport system permease large subunit